MKRYQPAKRLVELGLVLQYDSQNYKCIYKREKYLTVLERVAINQERASIMSGKDEFIQPLETKIQSILLIIKQSRWKPENEILYD